MSTSQRTPQPDLSRNLALIGGRGCGKSSIAKRLARCNRNFMLFSLDALIRYESAAASIPEIVADQGWVGFRDLEFEVLSKAASFSSGVLLDCGGGIVVDLDSSGNEIFSERKVSALRKHSRVVYLARDVDYLVSRVGSDPARPTLSEQHDFETIMARRDPWYRKAADLVIDCANDGKNEISRTVLRWFYEEVGIDPSEADRALRSLR